MFEIFPNLAKYFHAKIYPTGYGNRNRICSEFDRKITGLDDVGDLSNLRDNTSYKEYLNNEFINIQNIKRKKQSTLLWRIRGESF